MKYRDNMTDEELAKLLAECKALDDCYAYYTLAIDPSVDDDYDDDGEDEMELLRRAALDHRGQS